MDINNQNNYPEESGHHSDSSLYYMTRPGGNNIDKVRNLPDGHNPLEMWFAREPNKSIPCSLHLTNNIDQNVAFRLIEKSGTSMGHFKYEQLYGIVPPRSSYTLVMKKEQASLGLVIQSSTSGDRYKMLFKDQSKCDDFFSEAKEMGDLVHQVALKTVYSPLQIGLTTSEIISTEDISISTSIDGHPTEPWIITGHRDGRVFWWKYDSKSINQRQIRASSASAWTSWMHRVFHPKSSTQELMDSLKISEQPGILSGSFLTKLLTSSRHHHNGNK
ncbi:uncharacterized protein [Triticum aestivum]|uniref:uncharacterized protein n=1 Tax=Triticum aestivum TaxID=4565 RepID=UPI001D02A5AE|nr:uncharacterized protein LOC123158740 [Triticum aestivum]